MAAGETRGAGTSPQRSCSNRRSGDGSRTWPRLFASNAAALPFAHDSADSKRRDVGGGGQFLVADHEFDSVGNSAADSAGQVDQHFGQSLPRRVAVRATCAAMHTFR